MKVVAKAVVWVIAFPTILCGIALLPLMVAGFIFSSGLFYGADWAVFMHGNPDLEAVKLSSLVVAGGCMGLSFICTCPLVELILARVDRIGETDHDSTNDSNGTNEEPKETVPAVAE